MLCWFSLGLASKILFILMYHKDLSNNNIFVINKRLEGLNLQVFYLLQIYSNYIMYNNIFEMQYLSLISRKSIKLN